MSGLSGIGGIIGSIAQVAIVASILPLIIQLGAALLNLVGILAALPAAAGVAAAAFIPLKIAFNGVGEALAAIWSGDPEKIAEAMKNLAPHARVVTREFAAFVKPLKALGPAIQQGLFVPLEGSITKLGNTVLPVLQKQIAGLGWSWGKTLKQMADAVATPTFSQALSDVIASAARIVERFGPSIAGFISATIGLISKGVPYVERFAFWIASLVDKFNAWIASSTESGKVTGWLETAWYTGKQLYNVIKELATFVTLMFSAFSDEGTDTMTGLAESIKKVNDYLRSSEGAETLHNLGVVIHWVGNAWVFFIANMTVAYKALNLIFSFIRGIGPFVSKQFNDWKNRWKEFGDSAQSAWNTVKSYVMMAWNATVNFLKSSWTSVKNFFVNGWNGLVNTVTSWYTRTKNAIVNFPATLRQYIVDSVHTMAYRFGYLIGTIIRIILTLPDRVVAGLAAFRDGIISTWNAIANFFTNTIPALASRVAQWFADMWNRAYATVTTFVSNTATTVSELPGRVGNYITQTRDRAVSRFQELRDRAIERVRGLVTGAREEASKLPGRVADAISGVIGRTYDIGRDMIYGMINGMKSAAKALWNAARSVVMDAWQGAKDALQSKSPSKKWAELGEDSAAGYSVGFDDYDLPGAISSAIKMPLDAFARTNMRQQQAAPTVNVGGAQLVAYLQISDDQLQPVTIRMLRENPQEVAFAAQQGDTQLARRR